MTNYRRHFVPGGSYFFTVALADRSATLLTDHIDVLRNAFQRIRRELPFNIEAMVVLPEHLHCVWTLPPRGAWLDAVVFDEWFDLVGTYNVPTLPHPARAGHG